jgi:hypothetical protein
MSNRSIDPSPAAVIRVPPVHPLAPVPSMKHSPREILGQLLDSGKLSASELREVRRVYDALIAGRVGRLTPAEPMGRTTLSNVWGRVEPSEAAGARGQGDGARDPAATPARVRGHAETQSTAGQAMKPRAGKSPRSRSGSYCRRALCPPATRRVQTSAPAARSRSSRSSSSWV